MKKIQQFVAGHYWIIILFAIKTIAYYLLIDLSPISGFIGLFTLSYLLIIFYCCYTSKFKYSHYIFGIVYFIVTLWMFVDTVYFSYFNQLTSINQFWQMNSLVVVDESVKFATPPISILLFLDIPLVIRYFIKSRKTKPYEHSSTRITKPVLIIFMMSLMVIFALNPVQADALKKVNHTEFFTYHVKDVLENIRIDFSNEVKPIEEIIAVIQDNLDEVEDEKELTGIAKGKNLIVIQLESVQNFVIDAEYNGQEITPFLNELIKENSLYFDHYFQTIGKGNTADAEFATNNSFYPVIQGEAYRLYNDNVFEGLPWLMRERGYSATAYHGYKGDFWSRTTAYVHQGFEEFISLEKLEETEKIGFGLSDKELFRQTIEHMENLEEPFYSFIITLSNHHPFTLPEEYDSFQLKDEDKNTIFGNYLRSVNYTDEALKEFFAALKEKGLYDNTVIALYGDHHGLNSRDSANNKQMSEFLGYNYDYDQMLRIPLIIHMPGMNVTKTIHTVGGQVDFLPTIANLYDLEISQPFVFGRDLVNANSGFVASITYMLKGSFIKDGVIFEMSRDGIFGNSRAWDLDTGEPLSLEGLYEDYEKAITLIEESKYVLDNNLIEVFDQQASEDY